MIYMRKIILILFLHVVGILSAQNISVTSFRLLENDLTANTTGSIERDQNGESAALLKVVTTQQGFVFDGGALGIVKTKQKVGEIWVYVPHGIKKMTILHQQLGVLRDYYFPIPIEKARTYEMELTTGKVETIVTHSINKKFVIFKVEPSNAIVELNGEVLTIDNEEGYIEKGVPLGTYTYRVSCANYYTEVGHVTVGPQGNSEVNVKLRPNFGWIKFDGASELHGAYVYVDNERIGQLPFTSGKIKSGVHKVKVVKNLYKTYECQLEVSDNETQSVNVEMQPNFANVTLNADKGCEIWIDDKLKGIGQWTGPMEIGEYVVEVRKESCRPVSNVINIMSLFDRTIDLPSPTPIYGSIELTSRPTNAAVFIDGVEGGYTPLIISNVLVGNRTITFKKEGYDDVEKKVEIKEGEEESCSVTLREVSKELMVSISSNVSKASVCIDGKYIGVTPLTYSAFIGEKYLFELSKNNYKSIREIRGIESKSDGNQYFKLKPSREIDRKNSYVMATFNSGSSYYGFRYGGELGVSINRINLTTGINCYFLGKYYTYNGCIGDIENRESNSMLFFRLNSQIGYSFSLGNYFLFTPRVGIVYCPSILTGSEYVKNKIQILGNNAEILGSQKYLVTTDVDYSNMNTNIEMFTSDKYRILLATRLELMMFGCRIGVHMTPEYIMKEGFSINGGIVVRL